MPVCIRCGASLETTYKFCESCGYSVHQQTRATFSNYGSSSNSNCLRCGEMISTTDKFCGKCGYPIKRNKQNTSTNNASRSASNIKQLVCIRCGEKLGASDKFCGKCGYSANRNKKNAATNANTSTSNNVASAYYVSPSINEQDRVIAELNKMCEYFGKAQSLYDAHDKCYVTRNSIIQDMKNEKDDDFSPDKIALGLIIVGSMFFIVGPLIWGLIFSYKTSFIALIIGSLIGSGGVMLMIHANKHKRNYKKEIENCDAKLASISLELTKHYVNYGYCIIGPEYTNPKILARVRDIMVSRRAYSVDNAIKTLYHDCRRREFWAKGLMEGEINNNNDYGAKNAAAFIPSNYFFDKSFRYY